MIVSTATVVYRDNTTLGGGFTYVLFSSLLGEDF